MNALEDSLTPNNAQNTQQKLGVAFSYLERKYILYDVNFFCTLID